MNADAARQSPDRLGALMAAAQQGDAAAYRELLRALVPPLRAYVRRRLADPAEVDDVVQEILVAVHNARRSYDPARPFRPWLATIARRRVADRLVQLGRRRRWALLHAVFDETFSQDGPNMEEEAFDVGALHDAIGALPRRQREAVELVKLGEMTMAEAAARTGQSVGAVKTAVHRAMISLRRRLTGA